MTPDVIRVVLADDHPIVRAGVKSVLRKAPDIEMIGEASSGPEAVNLARQLRPDVVIMDLDMTGGDGTIATKEITAHEPTTKVLILSMHEESEWVALALQAGATGYVTKTAADGELEKAIRAVAYGDVYLRPSAAKLVLQQFVRKDAGYGDRTRFNALSDREKEVFTWVARGYSGPEIGQQLNVSAKTVETYKARIQQKLGVAHRAEYIRLAVHLRLFDQ